MSEQRDTSSSGSSPSLRHGLRTDEDQSATFVELFFDLVFVYAVTQVVGLIHHDPTATGVGHGVLAFWLVWWAWTQFTWALNSADARHRVVELATLVATATAFLMAYALPFAFDVGQGLWFVVPYVVVRLIGLGLYLAVADAERGQRAAVTQFAALSLVGLTLALLGGALDTSLRSGLWLAVIVADLVAGATAGRSPSWDLRLGHFAERHGLFVIIALGESLVAVGLTAADVPRTAELVAAMMLGVVIAALLWWTYFAWIHSTLEHAAGQVPGRMQVNMARDAFSFAHFVVVFGIVGLAVGLESAVAHPEEPLTLADTLFLVGGTIAFLLATAAALWRVTGEVLVPRLVVAVLLAAVCAVRLPLGAPWVLAIVAAGLAVVVLTEIRRSGGASVVEVVDSDEN